MDTLDKIVLISCYYVCSTFQCQYPFYFVKKFIEKSLRAIINLVSVLREHENVLIAAKFD